MDFCSVFVRRFVVNEMIQSEKDYVKDLGVIVEVRWRLFLKQRRVSAGQDVQLKLLNLRLRASCPGWRSEGSPRT